MSGGGELLHVLMHKHLHVLTSFLDKLMESLNKEQRWCQAKVTADVAEQLPEETAAKAKGPSTNEYKRMRRMEGPNSMIIIILIIILPPRLPRQRMVVLIGGIMTTSIWHPSTWHMPTSTRWRAVSSSSVTCCWQSRTWFWVKLNLLLWVF